MIQVYFSKETKKKKMKKVCHWLKSFTAEKKDVRRSFLMKARGGRRVNIHDLPEEEEGEEEEGQKKEIIGRTESFCGGVVGFIAHPDVHEKCFFWARIRLLQFSVAPPAGQVKLCLLLPFLLQQQAEVVQLMYTGGQPAEAIHQGHDLLTSQLETFRGAVFREVLDLPL